MPQSKQKLPGITFARACCAIGIILFHFACHSKSAFKIMHFTPNESWGFVFVTAFFAISGAVLYYNYPEVTSLKTFYFKRWKAIFPAFYIAFAYFFLENVYHTGTVFYGPPARTLLYSLFGMDGYLMFRTENYYLIGEWFLGAVILLYLLYPLLLKLMRKLPLITAAILLGAYVFVFKTHIFTISRACNPVTCLMSLYLGMLAVKYRRIVLENRIVGLIAAAVTVLLSCVHIPLNPVFVTQVHGIAFFVAMTQLGSFIMKTPLRRPVAEVAKLSYPIFLLQHKVILNALAVRNPASPVKSVVMLLLTILLTLVYAKALSVVTDAVCRSKPFKKLESFFVKE